MKNKRLFWGIILLFIGVVALLASLGVFEFSWLAARKLWPVLLVIIGILILPANDTVKAILLVLVLGISCLLYHYQAKQRNSFLDLFTTTDIRGPKTDTGNNLYRYAACSAWSGLVCKNKPQTTPCVSADTRLEVQMGAGQLNICGLCDELASATQGDKKLNLTTVKSNSTTILSLSTLNNRAQVLKGITKPINIKLNDTHIWDLDISAGASDIDIDLSRHTTEHIDISATTGDIKVKMGEYDIDSNISITAGFSKINIIVPKNANCTIDCPSALAHKDFPDFKLTSKNHWQSDNSETTHNIRINIDAAAAFITVTRV